MKARLLHREDDFDWRWALQAAATREAARYGRRYQVDNFDRNSGLPWNSGALTADLSLDTLFTAMARGDDCIFDVSRRVILSSVKTDLGTIEYRQGVLRDCLNQTSIVRQLYTIAVEANEKRRGHYLGTLTRFPDSVLRDALETMDELLVFLRRLRAAAELHAGKFSSEGWIAFFGMLKRDLDDDYFATVEAHLRALRFRNGEVISSGIGKANKAKGYALQRTPERKWTLRDWLSGFFEDKGLVYRFELAPRDEAGAQALQLLRNRGISLAATALGQAASHVRDFFSMLRAELAFYVGCINLHEQLVGKGEPTCIPRAEPADPIRLSFRGLYDAGLALTIDQRVVGNDADADRKDLVVITGPNTGGKSTFLRSVGLAQLMMQSGMFAPAERFSASICDGIFTHYKREEDASMTSGKFAEELSRMSMIVDHVRANTMILFNESFAATNEREGSEIARQILTALLENRIRVLCVTHMYELAHKFFETRKGHALFLRAGRQTDGIRTFKLTDGEPLPTSFGQDLYSRIFVSESNAGSVLESVDCSTGHAVPGIAKKRTAPKRHRPR
jgi:DNA mismatch repair ATPase MutS